MRERSSTGRDRGGVRKYKTVVIDPPWPIKGLLETKSLPQIKQDRLMRKPTLQGELKRVPYYLMTMHDILDFPINEYAAEECLLFIWVTNGKAEGVPIIKHALQMVSAWGFEYHTLITWYKHQGMAFHSPIRTATEHIIFAWRGSFNNLTEQKQAQMSSCIETSQQTKHSQKPALFYQLLRKWTPEPRIDLFARNAHQGFDGWGDEYVGEGPLQEFLQ